jgi:RNA polymerase sigma-70 factor (ECF subfamily)
MLLRGDGAMSIDHRMRGNSTSDSATALLAASDVTLIEAIAIGNKEAMRVLYKRYGVHV